MYPPPHMTAVQVKTEVYPPPHMTCVYPPPHMPCILQFTSLCRWSKRFAIYSATWLLTFLFFSFRFSNVLQSTLQHGYEHFLGQVNLAEQLSSSDCGISTGLINQKY